MDRSTWKMKSITASNLWWKLSVRYTGDGDKSLRARQSASVSAAGISSSSARLARANERLAGFIDQRIRDVELSPDCRLSCETCIKERARGRGGWEAPHPPL